MKLLQTLSDVLHEVLVPRADDDISKYMNREKGPILTQHTFPYPDMVIRDNREGVCLRYSYNMRMYRKKPNVRQRVGEIMEWQIMNCGGLNSFILGTWVDGEYQVSDDCLETLTGILDQLKEDEQSTRRQLAAYHVIQKDLVPLLTMIEDDPEVFSLAVKLLVNLTQPLEYAQAMYSSDKMKTVGPQFQYWEIGKMLVDAKTNCTGPKFAFCLMREMKRIIMDNGEYDMVEQDCETINQCLLLVRNLLYIQDSAGDDGLSQTHLGFLKNLFQMGIDDIILFVLNAKQKDHWGATIVQVMSLLYRDLVGEIFLQFDENSQCWDEPCDSSTCSACEAAMDQRDILQPYLKTSTYRSSRGSSKSMTECSKCDNSNAQENKQDEVPMQESGSSGAGSGTTSRTESGSGSGSRSLESDSPGSQSPRHTSEGSGSVLMEKFDKLCRVTGGSLKNTIVKVHKQESIDDRVSCVSSNDGETLQSDETESSVVEELGTYLIDFTTRFIQRGFSSLVHILKSSLIKNKHEVGQGKLDDSYFLWSIAFFLKFARKKELDIDIKNIRDVFSADIVGFLVFKAFSNGEEVFILNKNKSENSLAMKRLHLCVSALRELFKTLSYQLASTGMSAEEKRYLASFQKDLANMSDLRQLFLWLIKQYNPEYHSTQFLQDTIITNHYFLLLLEIWIEQNLCNDKRINMLTHVRQFGTSCVMKNYGHLLHNFTHNEHHVNNCVFTMMHHVAGDCELPEALLHVNILNTFLQIWDSDYPVTQVMNDLMEYVIQKFISKAEKCPLECALQLFVSADDDDTMAEVESEKMDEGNWTAEEEDKLVMWYSEFEGNPDFVEKIIELFDDMGVRKSKVEIVNKLYESNWLGTEDIEHVIKFDKDLHDLQDTEEEDASSDDTFHLLSELFNIEEGEEKSSPMDVSTLEEDKVLSYFLKELSAQGHKDQLKYLQKSLLEAAYVKLDGGLADKAHIEEPIMKHCVDIGQPIPLMMFCDDEELIINNMFMRLFLQQLGLYVSNESPYPRIPQEWTSIDLIEKARALGDINPEDVKFSMDQMTSHLPSTPTHNALDSYRSEIKV